MALQVKDASGATQTTGADVGGDGAYHYSISDFAPVATPTAMIIVKGSSTKTVKIKKISVTGAATAAGSMRIVLTRRSTAGTTTSATLVAVTPAKKDTNAGAATATVSEVTVANVDALGTTAGEVAAGRVCLTAIGSAATSFGVRPLEFVFGDKGDLPLVLRGTSQYLTIEGAGSGVPSGGKLDISIETTEDSL